MSPSSKSLLLVLGNLVSVTMVAWSSRAFYLHADLAGWGDAAADKEQYFLWWARFISVIIGRSRSHPLSALFLVLSMVCYRRSNCYGSVVVGEWNLIIQVVRFFVTAGVVRAGRCFRSSC
jgi:hypothetical protein